MEECKSVSGKLESDELPSQESMYFAFRALLRVVHELSVRVTGSGFVMHDFLDIPGNDLQSQMSMPMKLTFTAEDSTQPFRR